VSEDMSLQIQLQAENQTAAGFTEVDDALRGIKDFLKSVADAAREATNVVKDMGKTASDAAKSAGDGMKGFQDKTKSLRETIALTEEELRKMTDVSAIRTASGEVVKAEEMAISDLKKLYQEANDVNVMITKSMNHASGNSAGPSGHGGGGMFSNEGSMNLMYAGMTMGAAALPVDAAIKSSVGAFGQFSQAMANVNSMAQMSSSQLQKMSQQVMDLSKTVPVGPVDLANALYGIVGAGVPAADAMQFLKTAAQSSVAGQVDLTTATNALVYVMGSYGLKAKDIGQVSDQMFAANAAGAMTFQQFASSLGTVAGAAAATGVPFQQVAAATAALTNEGISSQRATMGLRALLMGIAAPTKVATKEAHSLGISWDENTLKSKGLVGMLQEAMSATHGNAQELKKLIPNIAAWTVAVDLGGKGAGQFTNAMNQMNSSSGATSRAMQAQLQGYQEKMSEMKSAVQGAQIAFVNGFAPAIEQAANVVKDLAQAFQNLSPRTQKVIGDIAIAAGAFLTVSAPLLMFLSGIGQLKIGLQSLGIIKNTEGEIGKFGKVAAAAFKTMMGPWGLLIAAVIAGVILLITHWKQINDWLKSHFGVDIPDVLHSLMTVFQTVWNAIREAVTVAIAFIEPYITDAVQRVSDFWKAIWPDLQKIFTEVWTAMKTDFQPVIALIRSIIETDLKVIEAMWKPTWNAIGAALKFVWDYMVGVIRVSWDIISGVIKVALDLLAGNWSKAWDDMKGTVKQVWADIKNSFQSMVKDAEDFGQNLIKAIGRGLEAAVGSVIQTAKNVISSIKGALGFGGGGSTSMSVTAPSASMAVTGGSGMTVHNYNFVVNASNNVTQSEQQLGDTVSRALYDKMKQQGKF
jgi:TP901 family phage tail tape measure protein